MNKQEREEQERDLKKILLWNAYEGGLDIEELVEWLYYTAGVRVRRDWCDIEKKILRSREITAREFASFLVTEGVEIDEEEWINLLINSKSISDKYRGSFCVDK